MDALDVSLNLFRLGFLAAFAVFLAHTLWLMSIMATQIRAVTPHAGRKIVMLYIVGFAGFFCMFVAFLRLGG